MERAGKGVQSIANLLKGLTVQRDNPLQPMTLMAYANAVLPLISIDDGGRSRGVLVGLLKQYRITIPDRIIRDRTFQKTGEFRMKDYMVGVKEGMNLPKHAMLSKFEAIASETNLQRMSQFLRDARRLAASFSAELSKILTKGR